MFWREARVVISAFLALTLVLQMALGAGAARAAESEEGAIEAIPPRLSYADGEVSYVGETVAIVTLLAGQVRPLNRRDLAHTRELQAA